MCVSVLWLRYLNANMIWDGSVEAQQLSPESYDVERDEDTFEECSIEGEPIYTIFGPVVVVFSKDVRDQTAEMAMLVSALARILHVRCGKAEGHAIDLARAAFEAAADSGTFFLERQDNWKDQKIQSKYHQASVSYFSMQDVLFPPSTARDSLDVMRVAGSFTVVKNPSPATDTIETSDLKLHDTH